ncbi:12571_t:CDS:2, partial [Funneliformis geosporum]
QLPFLMFQLRIDANPTKRPTAYELSEVLHGGLNSIHEQGLIHRDLHVGNILQGNFLDTGSCCIADLGLCKPANEANQREEVYGVLPYMAPE